MWARTEPWWVPVGVAGAIYLGSVTVSWVALTAFMAVGPGVMLALGLGWLITALWLLVWGARRSTHLRVGVALVGLGLMLGFLSWLLTPSDCLVTTPNCNSGYEIAADAIGLPVLFSGGFAIAIVAISGALHRAGRALTTRRQRRAAGTPVAG